jgi:hypothetical protein
MSQLVEELQELFGGLLLPAIDLLGLGEQHVIRWFRALAGHSVLPTPSRARTPGSGHGATCVDDPAATASAPEEESASRGSRRASAPWERRDLPSHDRIRLPAGTDLAIVLATKCTSGGPPRRRTRVSLAATTTTCASPRRERTRGRHALDDPSAASATSLSFFGWRAARERFGDNPSSNSTYRALRDHRWLSC